MTREKGSTLIELMIVVSIIGVLASIAVPSFQSYIAKSEVTEAFTMSAYARNQVTLRYIEKARFPRSNAQAGMPPSSRIKSNRITSISVENGAVHVSFGRGASKMIHGETLSFRPAYTSDATSGTIAWICGYSDPAQGLSVAGTNKTSVAEDYLPSACQASN